MSSKLKLEGELALDGSGWEKTLSKAGDGVDKLAKNVGGTLKNAFAGAFAIGSITAVIKSAIDLGSEINDTATRMGVSKTAAQEFSFAAKQTGVDLGDVANAMGKLSKAIVAVEDGGEAGAEMQKKFSKLGVTLAELKGKSPEELFKLIGQKMEGMTVTADVSAATLDIFGKSMTKLIPMLKELGDNIQKVHDHGLILDDATIAALDDAGDTLAELSLATKIFGAAILVSAKLAATGWYDYAKALVTVNEQMDKLAGDARVKAMEKTLASQKELTDMLKANSKRTTVDETDRTEEQMHAQTQAQNELDKDTESRKAKRAEKADDSLPIEKQIEKAKTNLSELEKAVKQFDSGSLPASDINNQIEKQKDKLGELQAKHLDAQFGALKKDGSQKVDVNSFQGIGNALGHTTREIPAIQERLIEAHTKTTDALHRVATALENANANGGNSSFQLP